VRRTRRLPFAELEPYLLELGVGCVGLSVQSSRIETDIAWPDKPTHPTLDWRAIFGNDHPVEVEVGFGKGLFLLSSGQARPDTNFLGIEIERKYQLFTANRLAKRGLANVRLACTDARMFFRDHIADRSLQAIHVFFPDPWWKKRHQKRRVFTEEFAGQCARVLAPGGKLHLLTDVAEYFALIQKILAGQSSLVPLTAAGQSGTIHGLEFLTNFERKYRQEGRPIFEAAYLSRPA
jgi:tRNA (guanine-N7-)-methyltransferase